MSVCDMQISEPRNCLQQSRGPNQTNPRKGIAMAGATDSVIWRQIPEFPNYEVSNYGAVRHRGGRKGVGPNFWIAPPRELSPSTGGDGYYRVGLMVGDTRKTKYVARLVAQAFLPNQFNFVEVNHIDGDKSNNSSDNLEWCTPSQNVRHKMDVLGKGIGENAPHNKLVNSDILGIRASQETAESLAGKYGVARSHIYNIRNRRCWRHV